MIQTNLCHTKKEQNHTYHVQHIYDCYVPLCTSKGCKIVVRAYYTNVKLTTYIDEPNSLFARCVNEIISKEQKPNNMSIFVKSRP
jgi:hypothetical protein